MYPLGYLQTNELHGPALHVLRALAAVGFSIFDFRVAVLLRFECLGIPG